MLETLKALNAIQKVALIVGVLLVFAKGEMYGGVMDQSEALMFWGSLIACGLVALLFGNRKD